MYVNKRSELAQRGNSAIENVCTIIIIIMNMHVHYTESCLLQHTRELISARKTPHKHTQQRHESSTVTLTWHACKYEVDKLQSNSFIKYVIYIM